MNIDHLAADLDPALVAARARAWPGVGALRAGAMLAVMVLPDSARRKADGASGTAPLPFLPGPDAG